MKGIIVISIVLLSVSTQEFSSKIACSTDSDCQSLVNNRYYCSGAVCEHESIFPSSMTDIAGLLSIIVVSMIANLGGIGGGEVIVSVYIYFFQYSIIEAIPLSKLTILAGAAINFAVNYNRRVPGNQNQFLVDYGLVSLIVPPMLAGTTVGVVFTKSFPTAITLVLVISLVLYYTVRMTMKAMQLHSMESLHCKQQPTAKPKGLLDRLHSFVADFRIRLAAQQTQPASSGSPSAVPRDLFDEVHDEEVRLAERRKSKPFSELISKDLRSIFIVATTLLVIVGSTLLRSQHVQGGSVCSSWALIVFAVAQLFCLMLSQFSFQNNLQVLTNLTIGSIEGNRRFFRWIMLNSYFAGIMAGTLGMGGGIIVNPMLIGVGISPEISTAISNVVVLLTSFSTSTQFFILGGVTLSNSVMTLLLAGLGSLVAAVYLDQVIRSYKRPSILVWILAFLLMVSSVTIPIAGRMRAQEEGSPFLFRSPC